MYDELFLFLRVAEFKSFTKAARELNIYQSTLSRKIATLEKQLKTKLFMRTTTHFELTINGKMLYEQAKDDEKIVQQHIITALNSKNSVFGELHVMLPQVLSLTKITPFIPQFLHNYPRLQLKISYQNHKVNLKNGDIDLAVIAEKPLQPSQKIKLLYRAKLVAFCTSNYIDRYGTPDIRDNDLRVIAVLRDHGEVINQTTVKNIHTSEIFEVKVNYQIASNSFVNNLSLVDSGEYIAITYLDVLQQDIVGQKNYIRLFEDYEFKEVDFYILKRVDDDARINICAEFIEACFTK